MAELSADSRNRTLSNPDTMAKIYQLKRMAIILNRLRNGRSARPDELVEYVSREMGLFDDSHSDVSLRTLQRDINTIAELFHIEIACNPSCGYMIVERGNSADEYETLLLNFELLSSIDADSVLQDYVIAEHRRPPFRIDISAVLKAIRNRHPIEFDYTLIRHDNMVVHKKIQPHFMKESQQRWYLAGYDADGQLKTFGMDRMDNVTVIEAERFKRNGSIDIPALFRDSFGIWNNPSDPEEEIILKYDALDGGFVKTLPLHHSQEILSDTTEGITVRLHLRITNDFVMALLARSRSVEVISPAHLRKRLHDVYAAALERNI